MIHMPIHIQGLALSFHDKVCFDDFRCSIHYGDRIAIVGRNGSGKSSLLQRLIQGLATADPEIRHAADIHFAHVPQVITDFEAQSGGERLNACLTQALAAGPNMLLLDEPSNHLDQRNRRALMRCLRKWQGTLLLVSHDLELIGQCTDTVWHIEDEKVRVFRGDYLDYLQERRSRHEAIEHALKLVDREREVAHEALMREQQRAAKSKRRGEKSIDQRKWPTVVSKSKTARAVETPGRKQAAIQARRNTLAEERRTLRLPESIKPTFSFDAAARGESTLVAIRHGRAGYPEQAPVLHDIALTVESRDRLALKGDNGSGKTTLVRAMLSDPQVWRAGDWMLPKLEDIAVLDQHYAMLAPHRTALETIASLRPAWSEVQLRRHLADYLFRTNAEVHTPVASLSGGEKARLCMARIGALTPRLIILDEPSNNLDLETRNHLVQVLQAFPGAMIVISHDEAFLEKIGTTGTLKLIKTS